MNIKEIIQYGTAVLMLVSGIILCYIAFFSSENKDVPDGTLWYLGQTIVYAATIFGFKIAFNDIRNNRNEKN